MKNKITRKVATLSVHLSPVLSPAKYCIESIPSKRHCASVALLEDNRRSLYARTHHFRLFSCKIFAVRTHVNREFLVPAIACFVADNSFTWFTLNVVLIRKWSENGTAELFMSKKYNVGSLKHSKTCVKF